MPLDQIRHSGGCLCAAVLYEVSGALRDVVNCHCTMCQRLHGVYGAHSKAQKADLRLTKDDGLSWYASSNRARRGFCRHCGSHLFWDAVSQDTVGIVAGTLDLPTGLATLGHIFVAEKSDFYELTDDHPSFNGTSDGNFDGDFL